MTWLLLFFIRVYQATLSRLLLAILGPVCRFEPSCSRYAAACIQIHGPLRGSLLSVKRLCKCHPFHPGGFDPPPPRSSRETGRSLSSPEGGQQDQLPPLGPRSLGQTGNERLAAGPPDQP